ncbi:kinase-like domain-containing protein, partial [Pisolithus orientalis]|uniref:kinase-like domain-containing protein n=1 Tax=Pisolithus orientalis TaxID=936130 RepID=UPI002224C61B
MKGGPTKPSLRPILGAAHREGTQEPTAARPQIVRNPRYDEPGNVPQQVHGPTGVRGEWTTPPSNLDAGGERGEWRHGSSYNPVPPTPQRERPTDAQGLDGWHRDTLRSLPQRPENVQMPGNGGNLPHRPTIVPFSREPPDLTGFIQKIGQYPDRLGGFADVWRCTSSRTGNGQGRELVAVKCIRLLGGDQSQQEVERVIRRFRGEVYVWVTLAPHEHVLPLRGTVNGFGHLPALVSPWAENGTLTDYVGRNHRQLSYGRRLKIILQVISGLQHLHFSNICHGDLTGSNILIDRNGDVLISDFGLSSVVAEFNQTSYFNSCRPGAVRWIDPEFFIDSVDRTDGSFPTARITNDIYSMGCIMLQILTGLIPYHDKNDWAVQLAKYSRQNPTIPPTVSRTFANLMEGCWDGNRHERPRLGEIKG